MHPHELYMKRCLELAQKAKGMTAPNPMVGALLVYEDRIIGEGWHKAYGQAHAEVNCLDNVSPADRHLIPESTMYVSLEPCAHHGKTPPCANRIVAEKIKKVVIANIDPFAKVAGKGIEILKENGIEVATGILEKEGRWVNRRFFCAHENERPYIILKWAQSGEGYFAPADRARFQITNLHSQQLAHKWRTEEGAILVGYNTALHDNPQLTARLWNGKQPLRVVLDRHLKLPASHKIFADDAHTWVINEPQEERNGHIHYIQLDFNADLLDKLMNRLYQSGILSLIVEGGAALLNSFIDADLWDEARILTGQNPLANGIAAPRLQQANSAFEAELDGDKLNVYIHNKSAYPYIADMPL